MLFMFHRLSKSRARSVKWTLPTEGRAEFVNDKMATTLDVLSTLLN